MLISVLVLISLAIGVYCWMSIKRIETFYKQIQSIKEHSISFDGFSSDTYFLFLKKSTILGSVILLQRIAHLISKKHQIIICDLSPARIEDMEIANKFQITAIPAVYKSENNQIQEVFSFKMLYDQPNMTNKDVLKYIQKEVI